MKANIALPVSALTLTIGALAIGLFATANRQKPARAAPALRQPAESSANADDFALREDSRDVTVAAAYAEQLTDYLDIAGHIEADPTRVVHVYPPVAGRLETVAVRPADRVVQGQVLAVLASSDVATSLAAYRQARADAQVKQQAVTRSQLLYEHNVIALRDYQQAQADAAASQAALVSAVERLTLLGVDTAHSSDQLTVRAPRAGVITDVQGAAGEYAKSLDNANPLCTIADLWTVWAIGDVYEQDLASVRVGDSADVTVRAYPNDHWRGRIAAISSTFDTATHTLKLRVVLRNAGLRLKPDMFASIRVIREVRTAVVVPQAAVVREGSAAYVFVRTTSWHFARRSVTLGRVAGTDRVEVTAGLAAGDSVVVEGAELLRAVASPL